TWVIVPPAGAFASRCKNVRGFAGIAVLQQLIRYETGTVGCLRRTDLGQGARRTKDSSSRCGWASVTTQLKNLVSPLHLPFHLVQDARTKVLLNQPWNWRAVADLVRPLLEHKELSGRAARRIYQAAK